MNIYLGNLTPKQIETRLGITLTDEDRAILGEARQEAVNNTQLEHGKWHCFDIPFTMMTHDKETAIKFRDLFMKYDASRFKECFQIAWET